jgi:hypothetical protein
MSFRKAVGFRSLLVDLSRGLDLLEGEHMRLVSGVDCGDVFPTGGPKVGL